MIARQNLLEGMIVHVRGHKLWPSRAIRFMLDVRRRRELRRGQTELTACWGNHDAILLRIDGNWYVGESQPPVANLKSLSEYEAGVNAGRYDIRFLWPHGACKTDGESAARHWIVNINNRPYDYAVYFRLIFKCLFGDWNKRAAGWTWAFYCTEGVRESWVKSVHLDPWTGNENPTPYTTEKRVETGEIEDWTDFVNSP